MPETVERYLSQSGDTPIHLFRVEITPDYYEELHRLFSLAGYGETKLIYNLYDAVASSVHLKIPIPGAYTCLSFANYILGTRYISIKVLNDALRPCMIFEGSLSALVSDYGQRTDRYLDDL